MKTLNLTALIDHLNAKETFRLVFLGDSITATEWIHPNWREIVEYVLKDKAGESVSDWKTASWGMRCYNCGFDGSATADIAKLMNDEVFSLYPDMVIYQVGDNDADLGVSVADYRKNLEENIDRLKTFVRKVVLVSDMGSLSEQLNAKYLEYVGVLRAVAKEKELQLVDIFDLFSENEMKKFFTLKSPGNEVVGIKPGEIDILHPNQLGNAYYAKVVLKDVFDVEFSPEKYFKSIEEGEMCPQY